MAATMSPPFTVTGLPLRDVIRSAVRQVRAARAERAAAVPVAGRSEAAPAVPSAGLPPCPVLEALLRGYSLADLRLEAVRAAGEAAGQRAHLEGLAAGRSYGDPALRGLTPADFAVRYLPEAVARAERSGAIADLLLRLVGHEAELERTLDRTLTEGAGV